MIYEGLWVRDQWGRGFLLVVTSWTWSWVGGGAKMVMAELLPVKGIYLCDFLLFSLTG